MYQPTPTHRLTSGLLAAAFTASQVVLPVPAAEAFNSASTVSAGSAPPPSITSVQSFQPDLFTGRASTGVPIAVPPGRRGVQPALALGYSSAGRNSWVGTGWGLDLGFIERSTRLGVPAYNSSDTFAFTFMGVNSELAQISDGTYRAKDEGAFLKIEDLAGAGWKITDRSGTQYFFGQTQTARMDKGPGQTFRWLLEKVLDVHGNFMRISYTQDAGQTYPLQIDYTGHEINGAQSLAPAARVEFILEDRDDVEISYRSGYGITTAKRLKEIRAYANNDLASKYVIEYEYSQRSRRTLLKRVTQFGTDGVTALPPVSFSYQSDEAPQYTVQSNQGLQGQAIWNIRAANHNTGHDNDDPCHPYLSKPWTATVTQQSGRVSSVNFQSFSDGRFHVDFPQDHYFHAWTWVYNDNSVSIGNFGHDVGCMWIEDAQGLRRANYPGSVALNPGWTIVHLAGYHQHESRSMDYTYALKNGVTFMNPTQFMKPQLAADVDGNGIMDFITFDPSSGTWKVQLATAAGPGPEQVWLTGFGDGSAQPIVGDWNGDGMADIGIISGQSVRFALSTGSSFQADAIPGFNFTVSDSKRTTGDFNGDGITDWVSYERGNWRFWLGTGSGFVYRSDWAFSNGNAADTPLVGDFNGDGLTDVGYHTGGASPRVIFSKGEGMINSAAIWYPNNTGLENLTTADVNGDGLTDLVGYDSATGRVRYLLSNGRNTFSPPQDLPAQFSLTGSGVFLQLGDFDGDGLMDPAVFDSFGASEIAYSGNNFVDLLKRIDNGIGGSTGITYTPSANCDNTCPIDGLQKLPFIVPLVHQVTADDGMGNTYTTTYAFDNGRYDPVEREFRGFRKATVIDALGNKSLTLFNQDAALKGRPSLSESRDAGGNLWSRTENTWVVDTPHSGVTWVKLDTVDSFACEGSELDCIHTRSRTVYDNYGNALESIAEGDVNEPNDTRITRTSYVHNLDKWILGKPTLVQTLNDAGQVAAQRRFAYDGLGYGADPVKGALTEESVWLSQPGASAQWLPTQLAYDAFGNVLTVTDALGRVTVNTYDNAGMYLLSIENALGHTRSMTYDSRTGQVLTTTDPNGQITTTEYDPLGRQTKTYGPNDSATLPTVAYDYDPCLTSGGCSAPIRSAVHSRIVSGQPEVLTVYAFADGLGRTIQTRTPAEDPAKHVVGGAVERDALGRVVKQWTTYLDDFSTSYVPHTAVGGLANPAEYFYDAAGRQHKTVAPDGAATESFFDGLSVTVRDAEGYETTRTSDIYGRLIEVREATGAITRYAYDALDNLVQVTDDAGNITSIEYDSLGRKLLMHDPDMGVWHYAYDAVDNLVAQTDAKGQVTAFAYDALNRLTNKTVGAGLPEEYTVAYAYDSPGNFSIGKLTHITDTSGTSSFNYDNLGRLISESKTIDAQTYTIARQYDRLGRLTSITYPDLDSVDYTYNAQGGIETIVLNKTAGGSQVIVSDVNYNAAGQMLDITYGNGVRTDYSYDPQTLRLDSLSTVHNAQLLQHFEYTFDAVGNVTQILDGVHSGTQYFSYDSLHRLVTANGSYGALTYGYDNIGNMTNKAGVSMAYGAGSAGPHAVTSTADGLTLTYDANGNQTSKTHAQFPELASTYRYDAANRLVEVSAPQQASFEVTFQAGWNLFSLPVIPADGAADALFPDFQADFDQISRVSNTPAPAGETPDWQHFVGDPVYNEFDVLEYGTGYAVYAKHPVTVAFTGRVPSANYAAALAPGWHLLPGIVLNASPVENVFGSIDYAQILEDNGSGSLIAASQADLAKAYWVQVNSASDWSAPVPGNPVTRFVYDGDGGRVKQVTADKTRLFLGDVYEVVAAGVGAGEKALHIFAGSQRVATYAPNPEPGTGNLLWYHGDHLGSSHVLTDESGALHALKEYKPYGEYSRSEGPAAGVDGEFSFTGQRLDTATGLHYYKARYYDAALGRFTQPDTIVQAPADPQTLNRYSYVRNNPVLYVDPSGHSFWDKVKRGYVALLTLGMSETIPLITKSIIKFSDAIGVDSRYPLAIYAGITAAVSGGIGSGVSAAIIGSTSAFSTSLAMASGEGRQITRKVAKEFFMDVVGMSPRSSYAMASFTTSTVFSIAVSASLNYAITKVSSPSILEQYERDLDILRNFSESDPQKVIVEIGSRPVLDRTDGLIAPRHKYIHFRNTGAIWEMGPDSNTGMIQTTNTARPSTWATNSRTFSAMITDSTIKIEARISANFTPDAMALYEAYFTNTPYNPFHLNSNFAVDSVVFGSGGKAALKGLGFTPAFRYE